MDRSTPLVSVLMVAYNSSRFIREAINSVLAQTYSNFELIVIDDHSLDDTWKIINEFSDVRIKKVRNASNLKEYPNRNMAIDLARGSYSIFIDGDDLIYPHGLDFMMQYALSFPDCAMIISRPWDERIVFPARITPAQFYGLEYLDRGAIGVNFTKVMFKTDVLQRTPRFPASVKFGDIYIQYQIGLKHNSVLIPDASTWWRRTPGQASEQYLKHYDQYLKHELWIKLEMLTRADCPMSAMEKHIAVCNLYGNLLRFLAKGLLRMKVAPVVSLIKKYPVSLKYIACALKRQRRNYFDQYSGNHPFRNGYG